MQQFFQISKSRLGNMGQSVLFAKLHWFFWGERGEAVNGSIGFLRGDNVTVMLSNS